MPNITIYEDITEQTLNRIAKELAPIGEGEHLELDVASYGGELLVAVAIIDLIRAKRLHTTCNIIGFATSAAAIIALSCEVVNISPLGSLMLHGAYNGENEKDDPGVQRCNAVQLSIIRKRCPQLSEQLFKQDNWFNAEQALKLGLVDHIISNKNETFNAACAKYAAMIKGGFMPSTELEEMVEQVKEDEPKAEDEPMEPPAEPSLIDVVEQLAKRVTELEDRINRMERPAEVEAEGDDEPEDKEQARITNMFKTLCPQGLCRPQACAPVAVNTAEAPRVHRVDYKKYAAFIDG